MHFSLTLASICETIVKDQHRKRLTVILRSCRNTFQRYIVRYFRSFERLAITTPRFHHFVFVALVEINHESFERGYTCVSSLLTPVELPVPLCPCSCESMTLFHLEQFIFLLVLKGADHHESFRRHEAATGQGVIGFEARLVSDREAELALMISRSKYRRRFLLREVELVFREHVELLSREERA